MLDAGSTGPPVRSGKAAEPRPGPFQYETRNLNFKLLKDDKNKSGVEKSSRLTTRLGKNKASRHGGDVIPKLSSGAMD